MSNLQIYRFKLYSTVIQTQPDLGNVGCKK